MKIKMAIMILLVSFSTTWAQFGPQQIISTNADGAYRAFPADLNSDGFIDVLSLSAEDDKIAWYENLDGQGNFGPEILIDQNTAWFLSYEVVDLDSDGDNDLLYIENNPNKLIWMENIDGAGNFSSEQVIVENQPDSAIVVEAKDLDNDEDLDLLVTFRNSYFDRIAWYENLDGSGTFGNEIPLINEDVHLTTPYLVDIDSDGLLDILTATDEYDPARIIWFKNLGNATFGPEQLIFQFDFFMSDWTSVRDMNFVDVNTDGKADILVTTSHDDFGWHYYWLQNYGQGDFSDPMTRNYSIRFFYDLDGDGDQDILYRNIDSLYWKENEDGLGTFGIPIIITTEVDTVMHAQAADINGDGHLDVVSASRDDDKIAWYENLGLGIEENSLKRIKLSPNPTTGLVQVSSEVEIQKIEVYDVLGTSIQSLKSTTLIDLSYCAAGFYFVKLIDQKGYSEIHKIIKE